MRWTAALGLVIALAAGGCMSAFPAETLRGVNRDVTIADLRAMPGGHLGERVMLGGEILATRPAVGRTEVEVLARPLHWDHSPYRNDRSDGRFLIRSAQFLDPAVFAQGRLVTVVGAVAGDEERAIGDLPYRYPVIASERLFLWPQPPPYPPPGLWDPYWGVYGPYGRPWRYWGPPPY